MLNKMNALTLMIVTGLFCPIRWQRSSACKSLKGLKSRSCIMQVSAAVRLMPIPPALVDSKKIGIESSLLNLSIRFCRSLISVCPSRRRKLYSNDSRKHPIKSRQLVHWEKISMRWPSQISSGNMVLSRTSFGLLYKSSVWRQYRSSSFYVEMM